MLLAAATLSSVPVAEGATKPQALHSPVRFRTELSILIAFSLLYFTDVAIRASEKFFWYDELFTLYFSRLPTFAALWAALKSGIDFNPPPFYLLTRACNQLFGEGHISTRIPEIIGFWIFSLCLYRFVSRRAGIFSGTVALLFPMLTGAYFYAYEARPHGLVLGFCGLALVFWQVAAEKSRPPYSLLAGFSLALFCAFMMHCFAIVLLAPFALAEVFRTSKSRKITWSIWLALLIPFCAACLVYVPLLHSYNTLDNGAAFSKVAVPGWTQVGHFYVSLLSPCILVIVAVLLVFAAARFLTENRHGRWEMQSAVASQDFVLGLMFTLLPCFGVALGKLVHGPFFHRYAMEAVAGLSIAIGMGAGLRTRHSRLALLLALILASAVVLNLAKLVSERAQGKGEWLVEPATKLPIDTTPGKPLALHPLLVSEESSLAIGVLNPLEFIYLVHYGPALRSHLYFVTPTASEFTYAAFMRFLQCCEPKFNAPVTYDEFARAHANYLVYGNPGNFDQIAFLGQRGSRLDSLEVNGGHFLARLSARPN